MQTDPQISPPSSRLGKTRLVLDRVGVIVLGGGEGKRLEPLTKERCKPAISFGGRYTLIDIPLSNSLTTGLSKIFVIGQYLAFSLQKHLQEFYTHNPLNQVQIQLMVPEERDGKKVWYKGTADAIRQNLNYLSEIPVDTFLVLSGDQLYTLDFEKMIRFALECDAEMVLAAQPVTQKNAKRFGLLKLKPGSSEIADFAEKPQEEAILREYTLDERSLAQLGFTDPGERNILGSMGIYLFKRQALFDLLQTDHREDFGKHLIKTQIQRGGVHAFLHTGYWEDIGTIESYYEANLALTAEGEGLNCYDVHSQIFTKNHNLPAAKILGTRINQSLICEGCLIEAEEITHSVVGVRSMLKKGVLIRDSILLGNEYYASPLPDGRAPVIGEKSVVVRAILDENVSLGRNVKLLNGARHTHYDSPPGEPALFVRDGIIIVPRGTHLPDGFTF